MWWGSVPGAVQLLAGEAERAAPVDRSRAARLWSLAAGAALLAGDTRAGLEHAERAHSVAGEGSEHPVLLARIYHALLLIAAGALARGRAARALGAGRRGRRRHRARLRRGARDGGPLPRLARGARRRPRPVRAHPDAARTTGATSVLLYALSWLAELDLRAGQWASAYASSAEALRLTEGLGQGAALTFALVNQARVEALLGHDQECRAHLDTALAVAARDGVGAARPHAEAVLGRLELSRSRVAEAVDHLEAAAWIAEEQGTFEAAIHGWPPDLVEAYVRAGRAAEASALLDRFADAAARGEEVWSPGAVARCRGLLAPRTPSTSRSARPSRCTRPPGCRSTWPAPSSATASGCAPAPPDRGPRAAPRRDRGVRPARRRGVRRAGPHRARRHRPDRPPRRGRPVGHPHRAGAAGRADRREGRHQPRGRGRAVPQPEDHRVPPALGATASSASAPAWRWPGLWPARPSSAAAVRRADDRHRGGVGVGPAPGTRAVPDATLRTRRSVCLG